MSASMVAARTRTPVTPNDVSGAYLAFCPPAPALVCDGDCRPECGVPTHSGLEAARDMNDQYGDCYDEAGSLNDCALMARRHLADGKLPPATVSPSLHDGLQSVLKVRFTDWDADMTVDLDVVLLEIFYHKRRSVCFDTRCMQQ
ncbi:hypothetical protein Bbelb_138670 [Branchiostoma belcheri]|nr:hypothetical protein Bbelb_138670 [Branchiostoma belcheri]